MSIIAVIQLVFELTSCFSCDASVYGRFFAPPLTTLHLVRRHLHLLLLVRRQTLLVHDHYDSIREISSTSSASGKGDAPWAPVRARPARSTRRSLRTSAQMVTPAAMQTIVRMAGTMMWNQNGRVDAVADDWE